MGAESLTLPDSVIRQIAAVIDFAGIGLAITLPNVRAVVRKWRDRTQRAYIGSFIVHDFMGGFALPSFFALCICPIAPGLVALLHKEHLMLAGLLGIIFVGKEVLSNETEMHASTRRVPPDTGSQAFEATRPD